MKKDNMSTQELIESYIGPDDHEYSHNIVAIALDADLQIAALKLENERLKSQLNVAETALKFIDRCQGGF
jgi:hypothetical protein